MSQASQIVVPKFALGRPPQTDDELWWAIRAMWGITVPRTKVCKHHSTPFEALAEAYFARVPVSLWHGSRGYGGKSYLLSVLVASEAAFMGAECSLLGGSGAQSLNVQAHTDELWAAPMAPRALIMAQNKHSFQLTNDGYAKSLMASQTSVRGPHPQRLRLDEIDEMDLDILQAAQGQPMRKRGIETQTVMSSTWQYPDKTMAEMMKRAEAAGWPIHSWCYKETSNPVDGWLDPSEVERKKLEIPRAMWEAEYDLQEPSFENRAIDPELLNLCFDAKLGEYDGNSPVITEEREPGARYVTGVDWAKSQDVTVAITYKMGEPWTCVAFQAMNRMPWPVMVKRVYRQWAGYGGELVHDATGLGQVVDDLLHDLCQSREEERRIADITMGRANSNDMFNDYILSIEQQKVRYPMIELLYNEHRYASMDDLFTSKGHAPDSVVAAALACTERKNRSGRIASVMGTPKASSWDLS